MQRPQQVWLDSSSPSRPESAAIHRKPCWWSRHAAIACLLDTESPKEARDMSEQKQPPEKPAEPDLEVEVIVEEIAIPMPGGGVTYQSRERRVVRRRSNMHGTA